MAKQITKAQADEIRAMQRSAAAVRGMQVFIILLGAGLAFLDNRGWPALLIGAGLALIMQSALPLIPPWLESHRPDD